MGADAVEDLSGISEKVVLPLPKMLVTV